MSENLQKLLKESLLNNSYDYDSMHNTLKKTWMNSFSYLYTLQKSFIEYEELFYFSNDKESRNSKLIGHLYLDKYNKANFNVDYNLIHVYDREDYRVSEFYCNQFSFKDMVYNPHIFSKIPVVIIDDHVIWDYKIKITKDCTQFTLPFKRNFVFELEINPETDDNIYKDHKIQVLVIDNIFYQRFTMNKSNVYFSKTTKTIKIYKNTIQKMHTDIISSDTSQYILDKYGLSNISQLTDIQKYELDKENKKRLKAVKIPSQDGTMMCSLHLPNLVGKTYELGTQLIPLEDHDDYYIGYLTDDIFSLLDNHSLNFFISLCFFNRLYHHKFYTGLTKTTANDDGADLLVVQENEMLPYKTPIPVENFMIFKNSINNEKGFLLEKNTEMIEMYYPNIYKIKDTSLVSGDEYDIYYFYYNSTDLKYTVLFDFYYKFLINKFNNEPLEKIINDIYYNRVDLEEYTEIEKEEFDAIFKKILNYKYFEHNYAESDFLNRYLLIPGNEDKTPTEYKDETLKEWIKIQPWVLRDYVIDQNKLNNSYHLFTNTIDLNSRIRYSTENEIGTPSREFDEARYVFSFNNNKVYPIMLNCRVFVDGIMVGDVYQERHLYMDYFYIPTDLVTEDSYIELEIFPEYNFSQELTFETLDDTKEITLLEPDDVIFPTMSDVYFVNKDNTERYDKGLFDFNIHYSKGDFKFESDDPEKPVKFTRISSFSITPKDEIILNKPIQLTITKNPKNVRFMMDREGYAYIEIVEKGFAFNNEYLRIFRNGRLIPKTKYKFISIYKNPRILFLEYFNIGDIIYIDITPYRYTEIYYQEEITEDTTLIDLRNIINKPFDIRYYDVYINGRKLSLNNVFSVSPYQLTLVNLKSNYNLVIYEKERDWEYFGLDYTKNIYYYSIDDLFNSGIVSEDMKNNMIKDIIDTTKDSRLNIYPNTNDEEKINFEPDNRKYVEFNIFYFDELLPKSYINPDLKQESKNIMLETFEEVYKLYLRSSLDESLTKDEKERRRYYPEVLCLDPDIYCKAESDSEAILVYEVGHADDNIDQKLLDQSIEIPVNGDIEKI